MPKGKVSKTLRRAVEKVVLELLEEQDTFIADDIVAKLGAQSTNLGPILRELARTGVLQRRAHKTRARDGIRRQVPVWTRGNGVKKERKAGEAPKVDRHGNRVCLDCGCKLAITSTKDNKTVRCGKCKRRGERDHRGMQRREAAGAAIIEGRCINSSARVFPAWLEELVRDQIIAFYREAHPDAPPDIVGRVAREAIDISEALAHEVRRLRDRVKQGLRTAQDNQELIDKGRRRRALGVLGLGLDASDDEIKKTYRRLARELHPDHGGSAEAMTELNEAWKILEDRS